MSSIEKMGAMESMFDPEQTTTALLEAVKINVANTVKTIDAAATLENKLSEEAAQFNACLNTMSNAIRKCERGEISREEMLAECAPCVAALKEKCVALKLADVKTTGDDITEDEIAMLREYIVGCKDIVADRKKELQDCPITKASEGLLAGLANFEPATEANMAMEIRHSTEAKTAAELYKQAKKLYGLGSKEQALTYLKKSQKLYENCLKKAEKHAKMIEVERTQKNSAKNNYGGSSAVEDKYKEKVTKNQSLAYVIEYFEDRIDSCKALEMQWSNKAGKSTYKETKAQLKGERKAVRHQNRLNKAKDRAGKKAASGLKRSGQLLGRQAYNEKMKAAKNTEEREAVESLFELMEATESFANELLIDYDLTYAMEAEGAEEEDSNAGLSENEKKLQDLYSQFYEAKSAGDEEKMNQLVGEIQKILDTVAKEASDAYTEDDLKAADRKLAKCLAIGAAVVATGAAIGVGVKTGAFAKVAETAKAQAKKLRESKGSNKSETGKGKGIINSLKSALTSLKGKFRKSKPKALPAPEAMIDGMSYSEFEASCEAMMDSMELELAMDSAMEAEGEDEGTDEGSATKSASGIGAKLRAAFAKLKKAKVEDNSSAVAEAEREIKEATDELAEAADAAETPEEKAKLSKAAKIGLAAAATAAGVVVTGAVIASKAKKSAAGKPGEIAVIKQDCGLLKKIANFVRSKKKAPKGSAENPIDAEYKVVESFLGSLAFGLEGVLIEGEDPDNDEVEPMEGKAFDDEDLIEEATEAAIAVMMAEDGIDDSDLM